MAKKYVGPENPPPKKDEKNERLKEQEELKEIKIERQKFADEKKKFKKERDNFQRKLKKGDKTMEPQEVERELKVLRGNITELLGIGKERQRQDRERRSKEEEEKRLKSIVEPLQTGLKDVGESIKGVEDDFNKFCAMNPEDPRCKNFTDQVSQRIKETLKPKEEPKKKEEKKAEPKTPESQVISEEDRKYYPQVEKWKEIANKILPGGKPIKSPDASMLAVAKDITDKVIADHPDQLQDIIERYTSPKVAEQLRKGYVNIESLNNEQRANIVTDICEKYPGMCRITRKKGINIQKKREGGMLGSPWKDIV